jgi:hypothetical protein
VLTVWLGVGCPVLCNPDGPHTPFGSPLLALFDTVRVVAILAGLWVIVQIPTAMRRCVTNAQRARFVALGLWAMAVITTESEHLGDVAGIRLALNVAAVGYALYGLRGFRTETPGVGRRAA